MIAAVARPVCRGAARALSSTSSWTAAITSWSEAGPSSPRGQRRPARGTPMSDAIESQRSGTQERSLPQLLETLAGFRAESRNPTATAYRDLCRIAVASAVTRDTTIGLEHGDATFTTGLDSDALTIQVTLCAVEDARRGGLDISSEVVQDLAKLAGVYEDIIPSLQLELSESTSSPQAVVDAVTRTAIAASNLEQMVLVADDHLRSGLSPNRNFASNMVRLACQWGCPRLAMQTLERFEDSDESGQMSLADSWIDVLQSSAECQFLEGVETAWSRVVQNGSYRPDEGITLAILAVAGRWGRPDLASSALDKMADLSLRIQQQHLAPLVEAFVNAGKVPEALETLSSMRSAGLEPSVSAAEPIIVRLTSAEIIDHAFYALEDLHAAGRIVDVTAINALIDASARLGDLQRVRATQSAAASLGVKPNTDTFNLVLSGCITAAHRQLGDTILSEMTAASVTPDVTTYERMILLCLTEPTYDDAFHFLEKMKAQELLPPYSVYRALVRKCVETGDRRWSLVVEELKQLGYRVDAGTQSFIGDSTGADIGTGDETQPRFRANNGQRRLGSPPPSPEGRGGPASAPSPR